MNEEKLQKINWDEVSEEDCYKMLLEVLIRDKANFKIIQEYRNGELVGTGIELGEEN